MNLGLENHLKPASRPSMARVAKTAVTTDMRRTDEQHEREALHARGREDEQHDAPSAP